MITFENNLTKTIARRFAGYLLIFEDEASSNIVPESLDSGHVADFVVWICEMY